jgi:hypothetical protein
MGVSFFQNASHMGFFHFVSAHAHMLKIGFLQLGNLDLYMTIDLYWLVHSMHFVV